MESHIIPASAPKGDKYAAILLPIIEAYTAFKLIEALDLIISLNKTLIGMLLIIFALKKDNVPYFMIVKSLPNKFDISFVTPLSFKQITITNILNKSGIKEYGSLLIESIKTKAYSFFIRQ